LAGEGKGGQKTGAGVVFAVAQLTLGAARRIGWKQHDRGNLSYLYTTGKLGLVRCSNSSYNLRSEPSSYRAIAIW
tara:strand:+ start:90 stop:314 length:225 start_codon:yes stop_codon:yes gene_type:complete